MPRRRQNDRSESPLQREGSFLRVSRAAMGGQFEVFLNAGQYDEATEAALAALDEVQRIEERLSIFRITSEINCVNHLAADGPVPVDAELFDLLALAVRLHGETGGALDVTSGPLSDSWGFSCREGKLPTQRQIDVAMTRVGCDKLELDAKRHTVRFRVPGMKINLGAIGKGHALDRCAAVLEARGIGHFMVHGGQSSVVARGAPCDVGSGETPGWIVGVHDPSRHGRRLAEIRLRDRALGTSGSEKQFFRHKGRRLSHVLDPRTGWPAEGLLSATVSAPTAVLADALSTALFVMGPDEAIAFCQTQNDLAAFLVEPKGSRIETRATGFTLGDLL
ncbi:MAG: FAD:protein FMN transferase [Pirellulales bacterium]|nr:FAD:protein FMN transferase [Pirellulales bacterium]